MLWMQVLRSKLSEFPLYKLAVLRFFQLIFFVLHKSVNSAVFHLSGKSQSSAIVP